MTCVNLLQNILVFFCILWIGSIVCTILTFYFSAESIWLKNQKNLTERKNEK